MSQPATPAIDLFGIPSDAGASCRGSGMGPEALRVAGLVETLATLGHSVIDNGDLTWEHRAAGGTPWRLSDERRAEVLAIARQSSTLALASLDAGHLPAFIGGDHSLSMGTISGVARHCAAIGRPLFVLWVDAHGDFNTPATSETGNIHGMPLALLCGEPDFGPDYEGEWRGLVDPRNVTIFGARSIDRPERQLLERRGVDVIDMRRIDEMGVVALMRDVLARGLRFDPRLGGRGGLRSLSGGHCGSEQQNCQCADRHYPVKQKVHHILLYDPTPGRELTSIPVASVSTEVNHGHC
mgnify:CR=1 FL=1